MKAKDIMTTEVVTVTPSTTVKEAAGLLIRHDISAMPVVDDGGALVGIVSERDLLRGSALPDPRASLNPPASPSRPRTVGDAMTANVVAAIPQTDMATLARLMVERSVKQIPIVLGRRVVGIVARRDVLATFARPDASIERDVAALLRREQRLLGTVDVHVAEGVAGLSGALDDETRRLVEQLVRGSPGVVGVRWSDV